MESIHVEYHFQGKTAATAIFEISEKEFQQQIIEPLKKQEKISHPCTVKIVDEHNNHLCTATMLWQIKNWEKVKLK